MLSEELLKLSEQVMVRATSGVGTYVIGPAAKPKAVPSPAPSVSTTTSTYHETPVYALRPNQYGQRCPEMRLQPAQTPQWGDY